ncbi:LANO_0G15478g1_1 [Lachancea nothofagi CBS 11611]|uniref:LANO_0G15478g1_1 n=1 Tax=Lachancea nothofagi CBS 11611 TaxID=1266666 RepID=A0A1G4KKL8_9SACH|nr:LANO_0G15478g1_1 [Lachancea nothofagi CBS 11611]
MGSQPSKPAETKVFTPKTQVDFTSTLLAQLEQSTEGDYTRQQLANRYLEQRVSEKLSQLEEETLKKFEDKLNTSLLSEDGHSNNELSSKALSEKVTHLNERLAKIKENQAIKLSNDSLKQCKEALANCLRDNEGKPLNCFEEVQNFKKLAFEH